MVVGECDAVEPAAMVGVMTAGEILLQLIELKIYALYDFDVSEPRAVGSVFSVFSSGG